MPQVKSLVKKDNLRIDTFAVGATDRVMLASKNTMRWKLRITSPSRLFVGLDRAVESDSAYLLASMAELRVEMYKGEIWCLSPSGTRTVYVYEESKE